MQQIARSLLVVGLSCGLLGGCMGDMEAAGESEQALAQEEGAYLEQEASSLGEEALDDAEIERGDYSTEICSGWAGYGSACQVRCSNGVWYTAGYHPNIASGDCTPAGVGFCAGWGMGATGHCWN